MLCGHCCERNRRETCATPRVDRSLLFQIHLPRQQIQFESYGAQLRLANLHSASRENKTSSVGRKERSREWRACFQVQAGRTWLVLPSHSSSSNSPQSDIGLRGTKKVAIGFAVKFEAGPVVWRCSRIEH